MHNNTPQIPPARLAALHDAAERAYTEQPDAHLSVPAREIVALCEQHMLTDDDLREIAARYDWIRELKTGKFALREKDMVADIDQLLATVQAQRDMLRELQEAA